MKDISYSEEEILRGQWEPGSLEALEQTVLMADSVQEDVDDTIVQEYVDEIMRMVEEIRAEKREQEAIQFARDLLGGKLNKKLLIRWLAL